MYKKDDKVVFKVGKESFEYTVVKVFDNRWYLSIVTASNSIIFYKLNIVDKFKFVKDISKYATDDKSVSFPEIVYPDETEINKVIDALLEKCDEYNKLNGTTMCYNHGDKIAFKLPGKNYNYRVVKDDISTVIRWYLTNDAWIGHNDQILNDLNIKDKIQFCRDVSGCDISSGIFPAIYCPDSTGISKIINKLMEMCEEQMKESLKTEGKISTETTSQKPIFKVGDYVRVIFRENVKDSNCYRFGFVKEMLPYCGNTYIVHYVFDSHSEAGSEPDDGMLYNLKTASGNILPYNFASSMLMPARNIIPPQSPFLEGIKLVDPFIDDCIQTKVDSETKMVSKKSTPEYKLKFTN